MDEHDIKNGIFPCLSYDKSVFIMSLGGGVYAHYLSLYWEVKMAETSSRPGGVTLHLNRTETELLNFTSGYLKSWHLTGHGYTSATSTKITGVPRSLNVWTTEEFAMEHGFRFFSAKVHAEMDAVAKEFCRMILPYTTSFVKDFLTNKELR